MACIVRKSTHKRRAPQAIVLDERRFASVTASEAAKNGVSRAHGVGGGGPALLDGGGGGDRELLDLAQQRGHVLHVLEVRLREASARERLRGVQHTNVWQLFSCRAKPPPSD